MCVFLSVLRLHFCILSPFTPPLNIKGHEVFWHGLNITIKVNYTSFILYFKKVNLHLNSSTVQQYNSSLVRLWAKQERRGKNIKLIHRDVFMLLVPALFWRGGGKDRKVQWQCVRKANTGEATACVWFLLTSQIIIVVCRMANRRTVFSTQPHSRCLPQYNLYKRQIEFSAMSLARQPEPWGWAWL